MWYNLILYHNSYVTVDVTVNLDTVLIQIKNHIIPMWYQFGEAVCVPKEVLNELSKYPADESVVEVVDYWLKNCPVNPTWREVAAVLKQIGLSELAEDIANVYTTGECSNLMYVMTIIRIYFSTSIWEEINQPNC